MTKNQLEKTIEKARNGLAYRNYLLVRDQVLAMLEHMPGSEKASEYWQQELDGFDYMFDASPLIIEKLRHQSYHLTGLYEYRYRTHHNKSAPKVEKRLQNLQKYDKSGLCVAESPELGGFGFSIDGKLFNDDTLKFYESFIVLDKAGAIEPLKNSHERPIVLEVGAGWGGWAYQWKTLLPHMTYVIVDLPGTILFSAVYLKTLFPHAKILISDGRAGSAKIPNARDYDFIFIPHYQWNELDIPRPDLMLNMVSFQEMTTGQVDAYVHKARQWCVPRLYSLNRDCSPNNPELSSVRDIIGNHFTITCDETARDMQHNVMATRFSLLKRMMSRKGKENPRLQYRHVIAACKV